MGGRANAGRRLRSDLLIENGEGLPPFLFGNRPAKIASLSPLTPHDPGDEKISSACPLTSGETCLPQHTYYISAESRHQQNRPRYPRGRFC